MAAHNISHMNCFDVENEDFIEYSERFSNYLLANSIEEDAMKKAVFLSTIGGPAYKLLRSLCEGNTSTKSYSQLIKLMTDHLNPTPNSIAQRFHFYKRDRKTGETVNEYIAELRKLSEHCEFGANLNEYLRDRIVCGLNSESVQQKLLTVKNLTLETALDIARTFEAAYRDARAIRGNAASDNNINESEHEVHKVEMKQHDGDKRECFRCGYTGHLANSCQFSKSECYNCGKIGHLRRRCRSGKKDAGLGKVKKAGIRNVSVGQGSRVEMKEDAGGEIDFLSLYSLNMGKKWCSEPVMVGLKINGKDVRMEVDTGAAVSVMSVSCYNRIRKGKECSLDSSDLVLKTYTGEVVKPEGVGVVDVSYKGQNCELPITIVAGNVPALIGRDWLSKLKLYWDELFPQERVINKLDDVDVRVSELIQEYPEVFTDKLGCLKGFKVHIPVHADAVPKFIKPRSVPYALRTRVEEELDKLESQGVWKKVQYSKWAAPIVPVLKDGKDPTGPIRICGDYKVTINKAAPVDSYPIPHTVDQLATLQGGEKYTKLDLSQAYQQLELDDSSQELLTINTHQGLYQPTRLQFGIHSATGIFQREMDKRLGRKPFVKVRVDDILISGHSDEEHISNIRFVLQTLKESGLTLKAAKCSFMKSEVTYCGYVISKHGVRPMPSNVEAVRDAPIPTNTTELRSFLGMVNYYNSYLPQLSTVAEPLHQLLRKDSRWNWGRDCEHAFKRIKSLLCEAPLLVHFDPSKPIVVHCDASPYGLGVVLSHIMNDGSEGPVCYASRTLTIAERNYAQIEKEGLALVFAVRRLHQFLFGVKFTMYTDHKPLLGLFAETNGLPAKSAARVLRWALLLSGYNYVLKYRSGNSNGNADALSRLPLDVKNGEMSQKIVSVFMMELVSAPVTEKEIKIATRSDPVLGKVMNMVLEGIDKTTTDKDDLKPYVIRLSELTTENGCLLWGGRVIIPVSLRGNVLNELHDVHPGMSKMKSLARSYVWWPGIDKDIEELVRKCETCQRNQSKPSKAPSHPWEFPVRPWERIHIDHAGPVNGRTYLVVVDSFSKWIEVEIVGSTDAKTSVNVLRKLFATHGLPRVVVSDNGPGFASEEFNTFLKGNGIKHLFTAPYHPASNGQVERIVRVLKDSLKTLTEGSIETKLCRFLFKYRITPQATTGVSPAELLFGRRLRSALTLMQPDLHANVVEKQYDAENKGKFRFLM